MFAADPDFAMGTIMTNTMELFGVPPSQAKQPRQKLVNLSTSSKAATLTQLEKYHLEAGLLLSQEDYKVGGLDLIVTLVLLYFIPMISGSNGPVRGHSPEVSPRRIRAPDGLLPGPDHGAHRQAEVAPSQQSRPWR